MSRNRALHLAIFEYHRKNEDLAHAMTYLDHLFHRNFKNKKYLVQLEDQLDDYAVGFKAQGHVVVETKRNIAIPAHADLIITGEIPRLDLVPRGGYAVWLFSAAADTWSQELRMPLIQAHYAERLGAPLTEVSVGFFDTESGSYSSVSLTADEVELAISEIREIASVLTTPRSLPPG